MVVQATGGVCGLGTCHSAGSDSNDCIFELWPCRYAAAEELSQVSDFLLRSID